MMAHPKSSLSKNGAQKRGRKATRVVLRKNIDLNKDKKEDVLFIYRNKKGRLVGIVKMSAAIKKNEYYKAVDVDGDKKKDVIGVYAPTRRGNGWYSVTVLTASDIDDIKKKSKKAEKAAKEIEKKAEELKKNAGQAKKKNSNKKNTPKTQVKKAEHVKMTAEEAQKTATYVRMRLGKIRKLIEGGKIGLAEKELESVEKRFEAARPVLMTIDAKKAEQIEGTIKEIKKKLGKK